MRAARINLPILVRDRPSPEDHGSHQRNADQSK